MTTELCTYTRNACDIARRTGVERIELCAAPLEGGTTPSAGLIRYARSLPGLRLSVMIRPRGGDFLYTDDEVALMAEEIRLAREYGADGVVFGLLTPAGEVDETRTAQLVREAEGMEVTGASKSWPEAASVRRMPGCWPPQGSTPCISAPAGNAKAACASAIRRFRWAGVPVFPNTP